MKQSSSPKMQTYILENIYSIVIFNFTNDKNGGYYFENDPWTGRPKPPSFKQSITSVLKDLKKILIGRGLYQVIRHIKQHGENNPKSPFTLKNLLFSILTNIALGWIIFGFVVIKPHTEAIVTRWGQYQRILKPGIHWHMRFIEKVNSVEIDQNKRYTQSILAFTRDEQLITGTLELSYQIHDSRQFLFNCTQPIELLRRTAISHFLEEIKNHSLSELFSSEIIGNIHKKLQSTLEAKIARYPIGLKLIAISPLKIRSPVELQKQFSTIQKAQQEISQLEQEAKKVATQIKRKTDEDIQKMYAKANIRKHEIITKAKSDISQFLALLPSYEEDPQLTTQQLYFEKIEKILKKTPKAFVIQPNHIAAQHNTPVQIPLDQLLSKLTEGPTKKYTPSHVTESQAN
jgi:membrane protease subunit HflK